MTLIGKWNSSLSHFVTFYPFMNSPHISAPQPDVSLKGVMGSMELAKSQLEGFTHMLDELLGKIGTFLIPSFTPWFLFF